MCTCTRIHTTARTCAYLHACTDQHAARPATQAYLYTFGAFKGHVTLTRPIRDAGLVSPMLSVSMRSITDVVIHCCAVTGDSDGDAAAALFTKINCTERTAACDDFELVFARSCVRMHGEVRVETWTELWKNRQVCAERLIFTAAGLVIDASRLESCIEKVDVCSAR